MLTPRRREASLTIAINPADAAQQLGHSTEILLRIYSEFIAEYSGHKDYSRFEVKNGEPSPRIGAFGGDKK
ncbi:MAG: hypothetical protein CSA53_03175 [Gammaproteobacteria bacterium]|nr:MAG: hypothetical protein CSA53_03175 [Gammaproteobacteria bacterium]